MRGLKLDDTCAGACSTFKGLEGRSGRGQGGLPTVELKGTMVTSCFRTLPVPLLNCHNQQTKYFVTDMHNLLQTTTGWIMFGTFVNPTAPVLVC